MQTKKMRGPRKWIGEEVESGKGEKLEEVGGVLGVKGRFNPDNGVVFSAARKTGKRLTVL